LAYLKTSMTEILGTSPTECAETRRKIIESGWWIANVAYYLNDGEEGYEEQQEKHLMASLQYA